MKGRRKHRVMLQRCIDSQDATTGAVTASFLDLGYWTCRILPASAREGEITGGIRDETEKKFVGRYNSTVASLLARDRAVGHDGTIYNFVGIPLVSDDNREATLRVRSGLNTG